MWHLSCWPMVSRDADITLLLWSREKVLTWHLILQALGFAKCYWRGSCLASPLFCECCWYDTIWWNLGSARCYSRVTRPTKYCGSMNRFLSHQFRKSSSSRGLSILCWTRELCYLATKPFSWFFYILFILYNFMLCKSMLTSKFNLFLLNVHLDTNLHGFSFDPRSI